MARMFFAVIIIGGLLSSVSFGYSGGSGTPGNPYQIATKADLLALAEDIGDYSECFILTADINMGGDVFGRAIITSGEFFTGTFDGNDHKITHFTINSGSGSNTCFGLFDRIASGGLVKNLGLENCAVSGGSDSQYVGTLVGNNHGSISNCYSTGEVSGDLYVGGLVGYNDSNSITNCYSTGEVSGDDYVGGLVGYNDSNSITNCYSTGNVTGWYDSSYLGGLVGDNDYGSISNCYSTGNVTGMVLSSYLGGLVGDNDYGSISDCYSTGAVVSGWYYVGGLVGSNYGSVFSSFWDVNTSGQTISDGGTGETTTLMKTRSTFTSAGWDFTTIWAICEGTNYPRLLWSIPAADLVCPDGVNFADYSFFAKRWLNTNCASKNNCDGTDFDFSGTVNIVDLKIFCDYWLEGL